MEREKLHPVDIREPLHHPIDISVMFNDGTIHTFENAMYYDTFGDDSRYYIQLKGGKRLVIDKADVKFVELPYLNKNL